MSDNEFPPNSHLSKEDRPHRNADKIDPEKKVVKRVTRGKVIVRKKPLYRRFFEAFRPEDNVSFVEHIVLEVLVDGIRDAASDAASAAIENILGGGGGHRRRRRSGGGYTSYNRMSEARPRNRRDRDDDRRSSRRDERTHDPREIILETRVECEEVLDNLIELASKYDAATRRDLYSMVGEPHTPVDEDWGWFDLRGARIHKIGRDGYLLDLPRPEYLE
jgi:hypothetical protein